jgi:dipeptidyl aminopeptidase/acylaminoacyl peptidase
VLQVNYRGSGGYGLEFQRGGYRQYGLRMQDDITDAVKWCIASGYADANRVGIFGASYGGYVVLAGLVFTPELYCCGIDYVGVADLELRSEGLRAALPKVLEEAFAITQLSPTKDADQLRATNPMNFIERIQAPVLCAYGKGDPRVRFEQWQKLEDRLQRHHKSYVALIKDNEGHGFRKLENRLEFFRKVDDFLERNMNLPEGRVKIGPAVTVPEKTGNE